MEQEEFNEIVKDIIPAGKNKEPEFINLEAAPLAA